MICERTVKKYCCEAISKIENYDKAIADTTQTWHCHHRMELITTGAVVDSTTQDLIDWGIYYDRPPEELIFLTQAEHTALHMKGNKNMLGKKCLPFSEEHKAKIAAALKDIKRGPFSEEHKAKISEARKGMKLSEETKHKMSEAHKGKTAPNKGKRWKLVDDKRVWY